MFNFSFLFRLLLRLYFILFYTSIFYKDGDWSMDQVGSME